MAQRKTLKESDFKRIHTKLGCRGCMFAVAEMLDSGPCCSYPGQIVPTKEGCPRRTERVPHPPVRQVQPAQQLGPQRMSAGTARR